MQARAFPRITLPSGKVLDGPVASWSKHVTRQKFLMDSWEGGETYRNAVYGIDCQGLPERNLVRHKREYPGPDETADGPGSDYELRRKRTPVPTLFRDAIESHLARIYGQEIARPDTNPKALIDWWRDVDGEGMSIDQWMDDVVAPILAVLGQVDILFDHPPAPAGVQIRSDADVRQYGLNRCIASVILPENVPWFRVDRYGAFLEILVRECDESGERYRYWDSGGWILYDANGREIEFGVHAFGCVPIIRVFDRKRPRDRMVGLPRYEPVAEIAREYYNRASELILSDTTQAHPLLQGPEDYVNPDGTVPIGPNWLLPKKRNNVGGAPSYEGFDVIEFPKDGADSIRQNMQDLVDMSDRQTGMTKPAGTDGTRAGTVSQSGVSKRLDSQKGNDLLGKLAKVFEKAEQAIGRMALVVMSDGNPSPEDLRAILVRYPTEFDLMDGSEFADAMIKIQAILAASGKAPETEGKLFKRLVRLIMPGLDDDEYRQIDEEIDRVMAEAAKAHAEQVKEAALMATAQRTAVENPAPVADPASDSAA